jgi:hypothetical protein
MSRGFGWWGRGGYTLAWIGLLGWRTAEWSERRSRMCKVSWWIEWEVEMLKGLACGVLCLFD